MTNIYENENRIQKTPLRGDNSTQHGAKLIGRVLLINTK